MKKGEVYTGRVLYADFPNKAVVEPIAKVDKGDLSANDVVIANASFIPMGEEEPSRVIVKNSIPGQEVSFMVNKKKHGKCEGRLLEVIKKADSETNKACPHFGNCGGCVYQTVDYNTQLEMKREQVKKLIDAVAKTDYEFEGILGSPKFEEYRNKMEFSFGDEFKDGPLALGLHKRNSMYDIVNVSGCKIVDKDYSKILDCVKAWAISNDLKFLGKNSHEGFLRHLLVRKAVKTKEILIDFITTTQENHDAKIKELSDALLKLDLEGKIVGVLHTLNDSIADVVINESTEIIYGQDFITEELLGLNFKIAAFAFFQTNSLGAEVLYSKAREYVGETKDKVIFDLYSGTGTIAQILAPVAKKVVGVEIVEDAVKSAKENAKLNELDNCEFIAEDVLTALDKIEDKPDFIVLDPPRDGINPKALEKIIDYGVDSMVYISCKPTSLQRDLVMLQERGYKIKKVCLVDMFPGTVHVETVCLLSKLSEAKHHI